MSSAEDTKHANTSISAQTAETFNLRNFIIHEYEDNPTGWRDMVSRRLSPYALRVSPMSEEEFADIESPQHRTAILEQEIIYSRALRAIVRSMYDEGQTALESNDISQAQAIHGTLVAIADANSGSDSADIYRLIAQAIHGMADRLRESIDSVKQQTSRNPG